MIIKNRLTRPVALLAVGLMGAGLVACGSDSSDSSTAPNDTTATAVRHDVIVTLQAGIPPTVPIQVAIDQGFFDKHGVDVELVPQPSGVIAQNLLSSDSANISVLSPSGITTSFQQGQEFAYACGAQLFNPVSLVAPLGSDLPSTADGATWQEVLQGLKGKTVGLPLPIGTGSSNLFVATLEEAGVDSDSVTIINTGSGPTLLGALEGKQVDAAVALSPGTELLTTGADPVAEELIYMPEGPAGYRDYGTGWTAYLPWLEKNQDAAKAFCDAMRDTEAFIADPANSEAFGEAITTAAGQFEPAQLTAIQDRLRPLFVNEIPRPALEAAIQRAIDQGVVKAEPVQTYDEMVFGPSAT